MVSNQSMRRVDETAVEQARRPMVEIRAEVWRRTSFVDGDTAVIFADGNDNFDNIWDNRLSLSYS